jgi:lipopolysaccharide export system permease protein
LILLRYFSKEVLLNTVAVSLVLLLVMLSARFVKYLASAAAGNLDTAVVFQLIIYRIPDFLQLILPLGMFIALLLVYGRLYLDNEMRIFYAAGISRFRILLFTLVPVLLVTIVVGMICFWVAPRGFATVERIIQEQDARSELDALQEGRFQLFRNNQGVIYVESIGTDQARNETALPAQATAPKKQMKNVYIFQQGASQQNVIIAAKRGSQLMDERGRYLVLEEGYRLKELGGDKSFEKVAFARYGQRIENRTQTEAHLQTDAMPSEELRKSDRRDYQVAWQWRLAIVLLIPVVALIAVALGEADPRQGRYFKLLPAILLYLLYLVLLNIVRDKLTAGKLPMFPGMWGVHSFFLLLGCVLFNFEKLHNLFLSWRASRRSSPVDAHPPEIRP